VFAPPGVLNQNVGIITKEIAEWAAQWTRYQLRLRILLWPIDAGNEVERMCCAIRALLQRAHPKGVSPSQMKEACHVRRPGSGGPEAFSRAFRAMLSPYGVAEMKKIGENRKGQPLFGLMPD
jgi:hypothetical protein